MLHVLMMPLGCQAEEMATFFDARTVKSQTGLQAPAILSVQGRNHAVQVTRTLGQDNATKDVQPGSAQCWHECKPCLTVLAKSRTAELLHGHGEGTASSCHQACLPMSVQLEALIRGFWQAQRGMACRLTLWQGASGTADVGHAASFHVKHAGV